MSGGLDRNILVLLQTVNSPHDALIFTSFGSLLRMCSTPIRSHVVDSVHSIERDGLRTRMRMSALTLGNSSSDYSGPESRQHAPPGLLAVVAFVAQRRHADPRC
jgi:hypothetical protein